MGKVRKIKSSAGTKAFDSRVNGKITTEQYVKSINDRVSQKRANDAREQRSSRRAAG